MDELLSGSAMNQAKAIAGRLVSSEELVRAHLERIASVNPMLNAVVRVDEERALVSARAADERLARGEACGPLHGVPFTVKDWIETSDLICAAGMNTRKSHIPKADATVVARMRAAGGILLGKTNVQETNEVYGGTRNPYHLTRSPGASSSGEAAIIAAGGSPLGLGSDSGGSLRYPAHCCGVATLKPTSGRVPNTGHFPRIGAMHDPRTVIGPISRHVEDLWPTLAVIAGEDWRDPSVVPARLEEPAAEIAGMRIGWFVTMPDAEPDDATVAMVSNVAKSLAEAGATVEEVDLPGIGEAMAITQTYWQRVESASWNEWRPDKPGTLSAEAIEESLFHWDRFRRGMARFMEHLDAIVCPVAEGPAPEHGGVSRQSYIYTLPFSLTGWPVAVVRAGTAGDGMPIAVQVVARPWREGDATAVARAVEGTFGGWQPPGAGEAS
jgi:amidase